MRIKELSVYLVALMASIATGYLWDYLIYKEANIADWILPSTVGIGSVLLYNKWKKK